MLSSLPPRVLGLLCVLVASILLGIMPTAGRLAFEVGADNAAVQLARFVIGVLLMTPLFFRYWPNFKILARRPGMMLILSLMVGGAAAGNVGAAQFIPVAVGSLLFFTFPLWIALVEHFTGRDRLTPVRFGAVLIGLVGVGLMLGLSDVSLDPRGVGLALLAAFSATVQLILIPRVSAEAGTMPVVALTSAAMAVLFIGVWAVEGVSFPTAPIGWGGIGVIAVGHVAGVFLLFRALLYLGPTRTAVSNNLEPMVSVIAAALVLGELLAPLQGVGGLLILAAVVMSQIETRRPEARPPVVDAVPADIPLEATEDDTRTVPGTVPGSGQGTVQGSVAPSAFPGERAERGKGR